MAAGAGGASATSGALSDAAAAAVAVSELERELERSMLNRDKYQLETGNLLPTLPVLGDGNSADASMAAAQVHVLLRGHRKSLLRYVAISTISSALLALPPSDHGHFDKTTILCLSDSNVQHL